MLIMVKIVEIDENVTLKLQMEEDLGSCNSAKQV